MPDKIQPDSHEIHDVRSEAPYFHALRSAPFPALIACDDGRLLMINDAFQTATGFSHEDIPTFDAWAERGLINTASGKKLDFSEFFKKGHAQKGPLGLSVKTKHGQSLAWDVFIDPLGRTTDDQQLIMVVAMDVTRATEQERRLEEITSRLEQEVDKRTKALNATIHQLEIEIAERKRVSKALTLSRERLKKISRRTLDVLEADRKTISKELHDSIGASLAAIKFSLEEKEVNREANHGRLDQPLNQEIDYLKAAIKETKRISANLRPTTLDDLGLLATVDWYLRQFRRLYGNVQVDYQSEITEEDIPEAIKIIVYRILQEGLNNVQKHSDANSVNLKMQFADGKRSICMIIEDNGRGFDPNEVLSEKDPLSGYGLIAMRERCEIFGGSFHIESHPGQGTRINATLPI